MNTIYYTLTSNDIGINKIVFEDIRVSKGETEIVINFSQLSNINQNIIKIEIDYGDSSPIYERNYNFNQDFNILQESVRHIYYPNQQFDNVIYYPTIIITYSNFTQLIIQLTLKVAKSSVFSDYKSVSVSSIQFVDDEDDSIFAVLESFNGDILNLKIK